ncbi:helix-turn-helix domain-containing protein [Nocardia shimofusensis]|uniref:helix-turn-helix domain-containing protein n=1 Tax=Nocardia shimofusensis TaxID=228596 RepID=UPI00147154BA|nr:helix-turn-helix transcriptional regulator [Nocardia shimofusensis]
MPQRETEMGIPAEVDDAPLRDPRAARIALGAYLRRLREDRRITAEAVAKSIHASASKISRIEGGHVRCRQDDLASLLDLYALDDASELAELQELAYCGNKIERKSSHERWAPKGLNRLRPLEKAATVLKCYETRHVPDLLQTPDYTRSVIGASFRGARGELICSAEQVDSRVALQLQRQKILTKRDPPRMWVLIEESALRARVAEEAIWRQQIEFLIAKTARQSDGRLSVTAQPGLTLQILRSEACAPAIIPHSVTYLRSNMFNLQDVIYWPTLQAFVLRHSPDEVRRFRETLDRVATLAEPVDHTSDILAAILDSRPLPPSVDIDRKYKHRPTSFTENRAMAQQRQSGRNR